MITKQSYLPEGENRIRRVKNWAKIEHCQASKDDKYSYVFVIDDKGKSYYLTCCKTTNLGAVFKNIENQITDQISKGVREDEVVIDSPYMEKIY